MSNHIVAEEFFNPAKHKVIFVNDHELWGNIFKTEFVFEYFGKHQKIVLDEYFIVEDYYLTPPNGGAQKVRKLLQVRDPLYFNLTVKDQWMVMYAMLLFLRSYNRPIREVLFLSDLAASEMIGYYFKVPSFLSLYVNPEDKGKPQQEYLAINSGNKTFKYDLHECYRFILHY